MLCKKFLRLLRPRYPSGSKSSLAAVGNAPRRDTNALHSIFEFCFSRADLMRGRVARMQSGKSRLLTASADSGKIPITTSSDDARKEFLQGRDLTEKLQANDSLQHFDKALSLDPNFPAAELARANASPTTKEFFDHLNKAVSLEDKASDGEKLQIEAAKLAPTETR